MYLSVGTEYKDSKVQGSLSTWLENKSFFFFFFKFPGETLSCIVDPKKFSADFLLLLVRGQAQAQLRFLILSMELPAHLRGRSSDWRCFE